MQPETATGLMSMGFPKPGRDVSFRDEWALRFQKSILATQYNMEEEYERMASERMARLVVCDRGMLDGAAFLASPWTSSWRWRAELSTQLTEIPPRTG